ncbi:MAG: imidazolonepropionase [Phycisphaerales bacterium JB050]
MTSTAPTLITNARVLTMTSPSDRGIPYAARRGRDHARLGVIEQGDVLITGSTITQVDAAGAITAPEGCRIVDARGRVLMPAFIDAHTHACWAGDRLDEWERKQAGATYLEILESGGGIMSTVRAVREASQDQLASSLLDRLNHMLGEGTTAVEVKSGYGLSTEAELKMLRAIRDAGERWAGHVTPTACIGHALDPDVDRQRFIDTTIHETLDAVHAEFPGIAIDAYCEQGAWSLEETIRLFERAMELDHPVRIHGDQFNELGITRWAHEHGALSVDHLEATSTEELVRLAPSESFGVMLPCSGFHVDGRYANGRGFLDAGGSLVIATNSNPGSAPTSSMPFAIALAVRHLGITAAEAITACTRNSAALLGLDDRGIIEEGMQADLVLLRHTDERQLGYEFGGNPVDAVWCAGNRIDDAAANG